MLRGTRRDARQYTLEKHDSLPSLSYLSLSHHARTPPSRHFERPYCTRRERRETACAPTRVSLLRHEKLTFCFVLFTVHPPRHRISLRVSYKSERGDLTLRFTTRLQLFHPHHISYRAGVMAWHGMAGDRSSAHHHIRRFFRSNKKSRVIEKEGNPPRFFSFAGIVNLSTGTLSHDSTSWILSTPRSRPHLFRSLIYSERTPPSVLSSRHTYHT